VGGVAYSPKAAWTSPNGLSWTPATIPSGVTDKILGGSSGFVTIKSDGSRATLWSSQDGRAWTKGKLPPEALAAAPDQLNFVPVAGGFVLSDLVGVDNLHQAAIWWSPDGATWTRDSLSGAVPSEYGSCLSVVRVDEHALVATMCLSEYLPEWAWLASADGRTWTELRLDPFDFIDGNWVFAGRDRGLVLSPSRPGALLVLDDSLALVLLKQSGDLPAGAYPFGLGPAGLLESDQGTRFWIGVPTAG
jgi:hypothetical protein